MKKLLPFLLVVFLSQTPNVSAQGVASSWSECTDGRAISRCETYNCPQGDTNDDGKCTLSDTNAKLTDARNDSFCANPISGCGQVHYYPSGASNACLERVEEAGLNCDLYAVANPTFTSSATTTPTASPRATSSPMATASGAPVSGRGGVELPKTGPEDYWPIFAILGLGVLGGFLYEKHKLV